MSIEEKFLAAVNVIESLPSDGTFQPSEGLMLKLYAYFMQATEGPCKTPKPSVWSYSSRIKWNAWNDLGNMEKEVAMEKYVEELTKVIETMSYNENVSKFMSLIGPFYEIVTSEEIDQLSEKNSNKKILSEYFYPVKKIEDLRDGTIRDSPKKKNDYLNMNTLNLSNLEILKQNKCEIPVSSPKVENIAQEHVINMFKAKNNSKHQPFGSQQDILILTFINLQNSLKEIVQKLDNLQCLAKSADFNLEVASDNKTSTEWNLGYRGTIFALLWPIAVHLYSRSFKIH